MIKLKGDFVILLYEKKSENLDHKKCESWLQHALGIRIRPEWIYCNLNLNKVIESEVLWSEKSVWVD